MTFITTKGSIYCPGVIGIGTYINVNNARADLLHSSLNSYVESNLLLEADEKIKSIVFDSTSVNFNWTGDLAIEVLNNNRQIADTGFDDFPGDRGEVSVNFDTNYYVNEGQLEIHLICSNWS